MTAMLELDRPHTDVALLDVCRCGQDLDVCTGEHCPRCGTTLH